MTDFAPRETSSPIEISPTPSVVRIHLPDPAASCPPVNSSPRRNLRLPSRRRRLLRRLDRLIAAQAADPSPDSALILLRLRLAADQLRSVTPCVPPSKTSPDRSAADLLTT